MARVAFILPNLRGGGAERVALTLIDDFLAAGDEVDLVLAEAMGEFLDAVPEQVRIVDLRAKSLRRAIWPLLRYFRQYRPDAAQVSMWPMTAIAVLAHRLSGVSSRLVISEHTILSRQYASGVARHLVRATTRLLYPLADARICVSEDCARDLASLSALSKSEFKVVNNPVSPPACGEPGATIMRMWPPGARRILTIGNAKEVKNHELLVRSLALVNRKVSVAVVIVGRGRLQPQIERLAEELGIGDRVTFAGFQLDVSPFYAAAELFVLSSDHEGYPLVLIEAMFAGLPIVSTDCASGPRMILDHGRFGQLVPPRDPRALADAIIDALSRPVDPQPGRVRAHALGSEAAESYRTLLFSTS